MERDSRVTVGNRLGSMLLDHFAMTMIMMAIIMPPMLFSIVDAFKIDHQPSSGFDTGVAFLFLFSLGFSTYFNKDIFKGRSPGKRAIKLQVLNAKTGEVAGPLRCLARNLTILFWPVEVIFVLINPQRRLGDYIAGTMVGYYEEGEREQPSINWKQVGIAALLGIGFSALVTIPYMTFLKSGVTKEVAYVESSYDPAESERANQLIMTSLPELIEKVDFRYYAQVEKDDRHYLAGILYFHNRSDYENIKNSERYIVDVLMDVYPLESHICFLKFVYEEPGSMSTRQKWYDNDK